MKPADLIAVKDNSLEVPSHRYKLLRSTYKNDLFCFFEGIGDPKYYQSRIQTYFQGEYHPIPCGRKSNVLALYNRFNKEPYKQAFFIDRDFDAEVNNPDIYETPSYSIENFYCTEVVVSKILISEFNLSKIDPTYKAIMDLFLKNQRVFHNAVLLFNSWYSALKEECKNNSVKLEVSLGPELPKDLLDININKIEKNYNLNSLNDKFKPPITLNNSVVFKHSKSLVKRHPVYSFRGKFEIQFLIKFLRFLIADANGNKQYIKNKTTFKIDSAQILTHLSSYAITPKCLISYLGKF